MPFLQTGVFNEDALSLDSKESAESGDVLTGTLIDFDDESDHHRRPSIPVPIIIRPTSDDDETDSASIISSSSGSSGNKMWDVITDVPESEPPIPPPRSRKKLRAPEVGQLIDIHSELPKAPHEHLLRERQQGSESPLNDFTSAIAEDLVNLSKRYSDPLVASTVSNTGHDLFNSVDTRHPPSDRNISVPSLPVSGPGKMATIVEANQPPTNDPWKPLDSPDLHTPKNTSGRTRAPPPPKPQPYIGTGPKVFMELYEKQPGAILTPDVTSEVDDTQRRKSDDPLADIFGNGGLHAYAFQQNTSPTNTSTT